MIRKGLAHYTALIGIWSILWRVRGDANGWLAALNAWAFWLQLSGLVSGLVSLRPVSGLAALLWTLVNLVLLQERFPLLRSGALSPSPLAAVEGDGRAGPGLHPGVAQGDVTLLSFNMLHKARDLKPFLDALEGAAPDMALFQECIEAHAAQLEPRLAPVYSHRLWLPHPSTNMGFGVASRLPFAVTGLWAMEPFEPYALRLTFPASPAWDLYVVQFISPTNQVRALGPTRLLHMREKQVGRVLAEIEARRRPAVVVGDWNSTEGNRVYTRAAARLVDGWREVHTSPGWTWPCSLNPFVDQPIPPLLRLDYLFHTGRRFGGSLRVMDMHTMDAPLGSDHRPIVARLGI